METSYVKKERYYLLDTMRGTAFLSMVFYHGVWDFVSLFEKDWPWFAGAIGYFWQQATCCTFILLSGLCWKLGKKQLRRGIFLLAAGSVISLVTGVFLPGQQILYGILTFLGSAYILMIPLDKILHRFPPFLGFPLFSALFAVTKNVNDGYFGWDLWFRMPLPQSLYRGQLANYLGFMEAGFSSMDYFSIFPWIFLFLSGYFLWQVLQRYVSFKTILSRQVRSLHFLTFLGRHALLFYILHQPLLYLGISLWAHFSK